MAASQWRAWRAWHCQSPSRPVHPARRSSMRRPLRRAARLHTPSAASPPKPLCKTCIGQTARHRSCSRRPRRPRLPRLPSVGHRGPLPMRRQCRSEASGDAALGTSRHRRPCRNGQLVDPRRCRLPQPRPSVGSASSLRRRASTPSTTASAQANGRLAVSAFAKLSDTIGRGPNVAATAARMRARTSGTTRSPRRAAPPTTTPRRW